MLCIGDNGFNSCLSWRRPARSCNLRNVHLFAVDCAPGASFAIRVTAEFRPFSRRNNSLDISRHRPCLWPVKCLEELQQFAVCFQPQRNRRLLPNAATADRRWAIEVRCCAFRRGMFYELLPNAVAAHLRRVGRSQPMPIRKPRRSPHHAESSNSSNNWSFLLYAGSLSRAPAGSELTDSNQNPFVC